MDQAPKRQDSQSSTKKVRCLDSGSNQLVFRFPQNERRTLHTWRRVSNEAVLCCSLRQKPRSATWVRGRASQTWPHPPRGRRERSLTIKASSCSAKSPKRRKRGFVSSSRVDRHRVRSVLCECASCKTTAAEHLAGTCQIT